MSDIFHKIPGISEHITTRYLGDEAFIMNLKNVKTYSLNETAARVWYFIDGSRTVDEIVQKVIAEYDVPDNLCSNAVSEIIDRFYTEKLVMYVDPHE